MKLEITVPDSLSEITLGQYQKYLQIAEDVTDEKFLASKMIEIFCNVKLSIFIYIYFFLTKNQSVNT